MIELVHYDDLTIDLPVDVYNALNRASREYEATITDMYYHLNNKGTFGSDLFNELFNDAMDAYFNYERQRNVVSHDFVIPAVRAAFNAAEDALIQNTWTVNFDGSHVCSITNIVIDENGETIYNEDISDEWIEKLPKLLAKREIYDELLAKLMTVMGENPAIRKEYANIRRAHIDTDIQYQDNVTTFNGSVIKDIFAKTDKDPSNFNWSIDYANKKLLITSKI